jgi:hypothetical protein
VPHNFQFTPHYLTVCSSVNPDIIFGTESWIDSSVKDAQILPGGFNIYRNDRNLNGGGVLLAVKDTLLTSAVPELQTNCEIVWCKLEICQVQ